MHNYTPSEERYIVAVGHHRLLWIGQYFGKWMAN